MKTNNDRHILQRCKSSAGTQSSFWRYKVCADIPSGSLEETLKDSGSVTHYDRLDLCVNILETVRDTSKLTIND